MGTGSPPQGKKSEIPCSLVLLRVESWSQTGPKNEKRGGEGKEKKKLDLEKKGGH